MKKRKVTKILTLGVLWMVLLLTACKKDTKEETLNGMSEKINEEGLTQKQLENALELKGKIFENLEAVGTEDPIYCNLPENTQSWDSIVPICYDPLYDILYYVDYGGDYMIHAIRNGTSELAVELPGRRLFCRGGKLYFLLDSYFKFSVKGANSGNILSYNPVNGEIEVVSDKIFDSIVVYQDLIYCRKVGEGSSSYTAKIDYWFYFFDTQELIAQEKQEVVSYALEIRRYGEFFLAGLYEPYDRSNPIEMLERLIEEGADPNEIRIRTKMELCRWDGSDGRTLEGLIELPADYYVKGDDLIWVTKDSIHTWNIPTQREKTVKLNYKDVGWILVDDKLYTQEGYIDLRDMVSWKGFYMTPEYTGLQIKEFYTDGKEVYGITGESSEVKSVSNRLCKIEIIRKEEALTSIPAENLESFEILYPDYSRIFKLIPMNS